MSIESLKQQARKHEQNEDWQKALDQYKKALAALARDEQVDIGLYNRVGDLYVRVGGLDEAVEHYDKAVELYREAYLPNNAIAVCKKIIRNVPQRHRAYLLIGQIRAEQGFLPDARTNFLTYAERMAADGDLEESFRALIEFCDLAPEEVSVRVMVAEQMVAQGLGEEAVEQLAVVHRHYVQVGDSQQAEDVKSRMVAIDPELDVDAMVSGMPTSSMGADGEIMADFGEIAIGGDDFGSGLESDVEISMGDAVEEASADAGAADVDAGLADFAIGGLDDGEEEAVELPMMDFDSSDDDEGEAVELPMMDFDSSDDDEGEAVELPTMDFDSSEDDEGEAVELPTMDLDSSEDEGEAFELPTMDIDSAGDAGTVDLPDITEEPSLTLDESALGGIELVPDDADSAPDTPAAATEGFEDEASDTDVGFGLEEPQEEFSASPEASEAMEDAVEEVAADSGTEEPAAVEAPPEPEPEAASGGDGFVDFRAMILGGSEEKTTRFTVAYEEPSGDEQADFAKMLAQFKDKVSENLDTRDVRAHYDLGTAYKEMGLLDEAIGSFQAALRASADHLPTYELMGQTFIEMGQPEAAVKSMERAVEVATAVEDELVGIYYYLGVAYEQLQNRKSAVEYYERVFSLDINFADVTERLRELR